MQTRKWSVCIVNDQAACSDYGGVCACGVQVGAGQEEDAGTEQSTTVSHINLVDLAGSERSKVAETYGDRLKVCVMT